MRWSLGLMVGVMACGPSTGGPTMGDGGGTGAGTTTGGADTSASGSSAAAESAGTTGADRGSDSATESGSLSSGESDSDGSESESDTGWAIADCGLAIRLDECCNQPLPATAAEVQRDACLVPWPFDPDELPRGLLDGCVAQQPEACERIGCQTTAPASEIVGFDDTGECVSVCPEQMSIGYASPGCDIPPPIAQCLPPPPPCVMDFCSCEGSTVVGCGHLSIPWAHEGPCK